MVGNATQHALPDQLLKPFGEQVARDSERGLKSLKPPCSQEAFPQDQKTPAIANHTYGAGQRTWFFLQGIPLHSCSLQSARHVESNPGTPTVAAILNRYSTRNNHPSSPYCSNKLSETGFY